MLRVEVSGYSLELYQNLRFPSPLSWILSRTPCSASSRLHHTPLPMLISPPQICFSKATSGPARPAPTSPADPAAQHALPRGHHCIHRSCTLARLPTHQPRYEVGLWSLLLAFEKHHANPGKTKLHSASLTHQSPPHPNLGFRKSAKPLPHLHSRHWPPSCPILRLWEESAPGTCL